MGLTSMISLLSVLVMCKVGLDIRWWVILAPAWCLLVVDFVVALIVVLSKRVDSLFSPKSLSPSTLSFCSSSLY